MARVVVGMSGGVDSSVAAALLRDAGHEVIGITMRLWTEPRPDAFPGKTQCCGIEDVDDARRVAQALDIPHYKLNLERPFRRFVVDDFVAAYAAGRTPNPCLNCNTFIKFDAFLERARALGAAGVATGHYARRADGPAGPELHRGRDPEKDQSYVLYTLTPAALARTWFPLGDLGKDAVRALAARYGLPVAAKPDSTDICFVPGGDYRDFVARSVPDRPGRFVDAAGEVLGEHRGVQHFTIGQRRGLGVTTGAPAFVTAIDAARNEVTLGAADDLLVDTVEVSDVHWLIPSPPGECEADVQLRYHAPTVRATIGPARAGAGWGDGACIRLHRPVRAVAAGQAAVFYDGDRVLGGGTVLRTRRCRGFGPAADAR